MPDTLQVVEGPKQQTSNESIAYTVGVAAYPGSGDPSSVVASVFNLSDNSDVTSTVMPTGSVSVSGNTITLKPLTLLTGGNTYKVQVQFARSGNTLEAYFVIKCPF